NSPTLRCACGPLTARWSLASTTGPAAACALPGPWPRPTWTFSGPTAMGARRGSRSMAFPGVPDLGCPWRYQHRTEGPDDPGGVQGHHDESRSTGVFVHTRASRVWGEGHDFRPVHPAAVALPLVRLRTTFGLAPSRSHGIGLEQGHRLQ